MTTINPLSEMVIEGVTDARDLFHEDTENETLTGMLGPGPKVAGEWI